MARNTRGSLVSNPQFESKAEVQALVDRAYALFANRQRGSVVSHQQISRAIGIVPADPRYRHVMRRVMRRMLKDRNIAVHGVATVGIGYSLLSVDDQVNESSRHLRKMVRAARRGKRAVDALPNETLTTHQQLRKTFGSQHLADEIVSIKQHLRMGETLSRVPESLPRPKLSEPESA